MMGEIGGRTRETVRGKGLVMVVVVVVVVVIVIE